MTQTQAHPTDPLQAVTHPNPYPYYAELRQRAPLVRDEASNFWVAARADTVRVILGDERLTVRPMSEPVPRAIVGQPAGEVFGRLARMNEGEDHRVARQALVKGLSAVDEEAVFRSARRHAAALIAHLGTRDAELLDTLAFALPVRVIAELVGLPADDGLEATVRQFIACLSPASTADALNGAHEAAVRLQAQLRPLTRGEPIRSALIERMVSGGLDSHADLPNVLVSNLLGLFSQTFEATAGLIGNSIVTLTRYRDATERLRSTPSDIHAFVHEVARFDPAVHNTRRFARETIAVEGATLQAGDAVLVVLAAASRDESAYARPDDFTWDRQRAPLPGFGAGRHACPGDAIARTIAAGIVAEVVESGFDFDNPMRRWTYRPSPNCRMPKFTLTGQA